MRTALGQTLVEYVLILVLVSLSTYVAFKELGIGVESKLQMAAACLDGTMCTTAAVDGDNDATDTPGDIAVPDNEPVAQNGFAPVYSSSNMYGESGTATGIGGGYEVAEEALGDNTADNNNGPNATTFFGTSGNGP